MRTSAHDEAVARRLELLSAELAREGRRTPHTRVRPVDPPEPETTGPDDAGESGPPDFAIPRPGRHAAPRRVGLPPWADRFALGPGPVAVVAVLVAAGLAGCLWWLLQGRPEPVEIEQASAVPLETPRGAGAAAEGASGEVVVDVAGKVRKPGIVVLEPGARVVDALQAAGGALPGVDLSGLNLARPLVDGEQVLVGVAPPPGAVGPGAGGRISLNTATAVQLEELPGVGPVTAGAIVAFREEHGPFTSVQELLDVSGIGEATLAKIEPHVTL